jgi:hypothetical protein
MVAVGMVNLGVLLGARRRDCGGRHPKAMPRRNFSALLRILPMMVIGKVPLPASFLLDGWKNWAGRGVYRVLPSSNGVDLRRRWADWQGENCGILELFAFLLEGGRVG